MSITLALYEEDYLTSIFITSKNKRIKKKRLTGWLTISGTFLLLAIMFKQSGNMFYMYYFFAASIICLLFYPLYQRYRYRKFYKKYVSENYTKRFGKVNTIEFNSAYILDKDTSSETKMNISEIEQIDEIGSHYFIKLGSGQALILPKSSVSQDIFAEIKSIFNKPEIKINRELNWKWK